MNSAQSIALIILKILRKEKKMYKLKIKQERKDFSVPERICLRFGAIDDLMNCINVIMSGGQGVGALSFEIADDKEEDDE